MNQINKNNSSVDGFDKSFLFRISPWLSLFTFLGALILSFLAFRTPSVAYVKTDELLSKYKGMIAAKEKFKQKADVWQANIDTLKAKLDSFSTDYKSKAGSLSESQKMEKERTFQAKQMELNKYTQAIGKQAEAEDKKLTEGVTKQVNSFLEEYGKSHGYTIIFGANGNGSIVYAKDAIDITAEVLKKLNE